MRAARLFDDRIEAVCIAPELSRLDERFPHAPRIVAGRQHRLNAVLTSSGTDDDDIVAYYGVTKVF